MSGIPVKGRGRHLHALSPARTRACSDCHETERHLASGRELRRGNSSDSHHAPTDDQGRLVLDVGVGRVASVRGKYDWLRISNGPDDRLLRRKCAHLTMQATVHGGFTVWGEFVPLRHVKAMVEGTRFVRPHDEIEHESRSTVKESHLLEIHAPGLAVNVAVEKAQAGKRVVLVNAASAFQPGGGFSVGGRHALEEALCVQSTLIESLSVAQARAKKEGIAPSVHNRPPRKACGGEWLAYLPEEGVVFSPSVEVFRGSTSEGYPFWSEVITLAAVVSVSLPNCNLHVSDAPLNRPADEGQYVELLKSKFVSLCKACVLASVDVLVLPAVGCGVYMNRPTVVGATFGEVVCTLFPNTFEEIHLVGEQAFGAAVVEVFRKYNRRLRSPSVKDQVPSRRSGAAALSKELYRRESVETTGVDIFEL